MSATNVAARRHSRKATLARTAAVVISMAMVSVLIIDQSRAAFTAQTENTTNGFTAGSIALTDNDGGATAMFDLADRLVPGQAVVSCIEVTYTGDVATNGVKVYVPGYTDSGTFAQHLDIQIEEETTSPATAFDDCTNFVGTAISGLTTIASMPTTFGGAVGTWAPTATASQWYKFTVTLGTDTPNSEQGESVSALSFRWETSAGT